MLVLNYGLASSVANSPHLVETVRQLLAFISELEASLAHLQENALTPEDAAWVLSGWREHKRHPKRECLCVKCESLRNKLEGYSQCP